METTSKQATSNGMLGVPGSRVLGQPIDGPTCQCGLATWRQPQPVSLAPLLLLRSLLPSSHLPNSVSTEYTFLPFSLWGSFSIFCAVGLLLSLDLNSASILEKFSASCKTFKHFLMTVASHYTSLTCVSCLPNTQARSCGTSGHCSGAVLTPGYCIRVYHSMKKSRRSGKQDFNTYF